MTTISVDELLADLNSRIKKMNDELAPAHKALGEAHMRAKVDSQYEQAVRSWEHDIERITENLSNLRMLAADINIAAGEASKP